MLRFPFDEKKALEALVMVTRAWPGITAYFAAKVFFIADKQHLNKYGRPVVGDRYIAMDHGPVPSAIYDWFKGNLNLMGDPESLLAAVTFEPEGNYVRATARRDPDMKYLAESDIEALEAAIQFCKGRTLASLSAITHREVAWQEASLNSEMDPLKLIDPENRDKIVEVAEEYALHGVP
jgi:uncharacterized phage-associated protein